MNNPEKTLIYPDMTLNGEGCRRGITAVESTLHKKHAFPDGHVNEFAAVLLYD